NLAPNCKVWPASSDRPLPAVPVPLGSGHADLTLELQPLVDAIYERNRYAEEIDYTRPLDPPLRPEEEAFLPGRGKAKKRKGRYRSAAPGPAIVGRPGGRSRGPDRDTQRCAIARYSCPRWCQALLSGSAATAAVSSPTARSDCPRYSATMPRLKRATGPSP